MLTAAYEVRSNTPNKNSGYMNLSIAVPVYTRYRQEYEKNREQLTKKGITSFAGYVTSMLEELMERNEIFARQAPFLQEFGYDEGNNTIYIKDNRTNRVAGVTIRGNGLNCDVDDRDDCVHIGFAYALPQVYRVMEKLGIRPPKVKA
jgi:hypothetical protein